MTDVVAVLRDSLGDMAVLTKPADLAGYMHDNYARAPAEALAAVVRPGGTADVATVARACSAAGMPMVVRGGGTGFAGGAVPMSGQRVVVISLERMRRIRSLDTVGNVMVVEAGCTLHDAQTAAAETDRLLGLDHGGKSSQIGGNLSTNAGGNNVVRYGMAREQVLGVEAVLADGTVLGPPQVLRKNNTGYDLAQLLAGAEGTLAIVTAVALKLRSPPVARATAVLTVDSPARAVDLFGFARGLLGDCIVAFELIPRDGLRFLFARHPDARLPFDGDPAWCVLLEAESQTVFLDLDRGFEVLMEQALAEGLVGTGAVAASEAQRAALWHLREGMAVAMSETPVPMVRTDTAVPIAAVPDFIDRVSPACRAVDPDCRLISFGHIGDGNIHVNVLPAADADDSDFRARMPAFSQAVEDTALSCGGTVSAEHGIGQGKRAALARMKPEGDRAWLRAVKRALDPHGLLNPGKLL